MTNDISKTVIVNQKTMPEPRIQMYMNFPLSWLEIRQALNVLLSSSQNLSAPYGMQHVTHIWSRLFIQLRFATVEKSKTPNKFEQLLNSLCKIMNKRAIWQP